MSVYFHFHVRLYILDTYGFICVASEIKKFTVVDKGQSQENLNSFQCGMKTEYNEHIAGQ